jgi:hypothetical protein
MTRANDRGEGFTGRHCLPWTMAMDGARPLMVARTARRGPTTDGALLRPWAAAAHQRVPRNHPQLR